MSLPAFISLKLGSFLLLVLRIGVTVICNDLCQVHCGLGPTLYCNGVSQWKTTPFA